MYLDMMTCIPASSAVVPASTMRSAQLSPAPNSSLTGWSLARASCTVLYCTVPGQGELQPRVHLPVAPGGEPGYNTCFKMFGIINMVPSSCHLILAPLQPPR